MGRLVEDERTRFYALARPRGRRSRRVLERRVRGKARATVGCRVEHFEHERLVAAHARKIKPAVARVVAQPVGLPDAVWVAAFRDEQVAELDALRLQIAGLA